MNYMENYYVIIQKQISSLEVMNQIRPKHLAYLKEVHNKGELIVAGRYKNGTGGLIIVCTENYERALEIAQNDPYCSIESKAKPRAIQSPNKPGTDDK